MSFFCMSFRLLISVALLSLLISTNCGEGFNFGGASGPLKEGARSRPQGFNMFPWMVEYKGFERATGLQLSFDDPMPKDKSTLESLNFYWAQPKMKSFDPGRFTSMKLEWESRNYEGGMSFTGAAIGVHRISPNTAITDWFAQRGQDVRARYKPYVSFRMGYSLTQNAPVIGVPVIGLLSYTLSDDYRFPADGPHGYQKISLKGFKAEMSFKF